MEQSSEKNDIIQDWSPYLRVYKNGKVERPLETSVPPSLEDPNFNVLSKDVIYLQEHDMSCRIYLPKNTSPNQKLPLLVYFHGGGFCLETPFSPMYHKYMNIISQEANVVAVSVDYRRAPECPIPIPYEDSWSALQWVASHVNGDGNEEWLNRYVDFDQVFFGGDSAGGNITHQMAIKNGRNKLIGLDVQGIILGHPFFWGKEPIGNELNSQMWAKVDGAWKFLAPDNYSKYGYDDPLINPVLDPNLGLIGCRRVLVLVAEKDVLRDRGWLYYENLKKSGFQGVLEIIETENEDHGFHVKDPNCKKALDLHKKIASFINHH